MSGRMVHLELPVSRRPGGADRSPTQRDPAVPAAGFEGDLSGLSQARG